MRIHHPRGPLALWICVLLLLAACSTVPGTGRKQLSFIPGDQLQMAAQEQFAQMKQQVPISHDPQYNAMMQRVGIRIAAAVADEMPGAEWEFVVFDDPQINAFAMPGGKVGVYTGLLQIVDSDDELATVMGHEIAHVVANHGGERASQQTLAQLGAQGLGIWSQGKSETTQQITSLAYGVGVQYGALLPFSRLQESEADHLGLLYAARAGYDPRAAITFWQKMAEQTGAQGEPPEFLSTHPNHENRIERLRELMPEALEEYADAAR
jgi:predicted Zn-dependent protease